MLGDSRIPHHLRLTIFFLRLAVGVDFFAAGWNILFGHLLPTDLTSHVVWIEWALLVIGALLFVGLATRFVSIVAIAIVLANYWPTTATHIEMIIVIICLAILCLAKAGSYLGLDAFFHFSLRHKK